MLLCAAAGSAIAVPCIPGAPTSAHLRNVPLQQRVRPATRAITTLAMRRNLANGVAVEPWSADLDHPLVPALYTMLAGLPAAIKAMARDHVVAIYLLRGNFGSARVEAAHNAHGRLIGGCILLNLDALERTANSWASWREGSAFRADERYRIRVTLEPPATDSKENALRFVFLHELGHILGMAAGVHGFWAAPQTWWLTIRSPYTGLSWKTDGSQWLSPGKRRFPVLGLPRFYRFEASPLPLSAAPQVYRALSETNWPSLYGSIDPYEDFAEAFAIYVHTRMLGRPYRVDLYLGAARSGEYSSCLDTGRCPQKLAFMRRLTARRDTF